MTDSRDLAHRDEARPPADPAGSNSVVLQVLAMAKDPSVDADKVKTLADLAVTLQDRELKAEFQRDLNAAMMDMPVITRDGQIVIPANRDKGTPERKQGRFARFEDIDRVCRPILKAHRLAIRFDVGERQGGGVTVTPILSHSNGYEHVGKALAAPIDTSGAKNNVQGVGSAITYLKRYGYCAALNIVTEGIDDDGNMGRAAIVTLPHEREDTVRREAAEAHEAGRYAQWFGTQSPKDRAFLIGSGLHAEYGGQPALPPVSERPEAKPKETESVSSDPSGSQVTGDKGGPSGQEAEAAHQPTTKPRRTPRQWVDGFKGELGKCQTVGFLDEFMEGKRELLDKLKDSDPALWEETQQAYRDRKAAIEEGRLV